MSDHRPATANDVGIPLASDGHSPTVGPILLNDHYLSPIRTVVDGSKLPPNFSAARSRASRTRAACQ